jgi:hypothetical protein
MVHAVVMAGHNITASLISPYTEPLWNPLELTRAGSGELHPNSLSELTLPLPVEESANVIRWINLEFAKSEALPTDAPYLSMLSYRIDLLNQRRAFTLAQAVGQPAIELTAAGPAVIFCKPEKV